MRTRGRRPSAAALWVWLPALLVAAAVLLTPLWLVVRSLEAGPALVDQLFRPRNLRVLLGTLALVATVTVGSALIAMPLAWITVRCELPLRRTWSVLTALPLVIPSYVGALAMIAALGPRGTISRWLETLTGQPLPSIYGFAGASLTLILLSYPYMLLSLRAGLRDLDVSLEEASRSLGAGRWRTFRRVVLPQMSPSIAAGALLVALYTLSDFGAVSLLRYDTFTSVIYLQYQTSFDRSLAAGLSLVLVLMTLGILVLESAARGKARYYRASAGPGRPGRRRGGRYRWLLMLLPASVALLSLGIPLAVLAYWLVRGLSAGEQLGALWQPAVQSAAVSVAAALVCLVAAVPIAILAVRHGGPLARAIERASYIGFGLPGIVVALALVFFATRLARPLYQTLPLLVFAYLILFLPQAVGALRAGMVRIKPSVEEAGRSLGRGPWSVARTVTLPLLRSGIIAALALVFLTTMKELPATLVLGPIGFETLATKVWSATDNAYFARAAAPALLLVAVSALPMGLLLWGERERV